MGPHITFSGANIHIVSGSGATNEAGNPRGLGNLIIGYDEGPDFGLSPGDRGGSHNLVIGPGHRFTQAAFGGLVAGQQNMIQGQSTTVAGGFANLASGPYASVSGGQVNTASGFAASISGGESNTASSSVASVTAVPITSPVGVAPVIIGGRGIIDNNDLSIAPQPPFP